jgi:tetratricopeptide (TPR) repeat protein
MMHHSNNMTKYPLNERALEAMRSNAASIADIEASERAQRTTFGDENDQPENPSNRYQRTCELLHSAVNDGGKLPSIEEVPGFPRPKPCAMNPETMETQEAEIAIAPLDHTEVQHLNGEASEYALRGNEKAAIALYKRALVLTTGEVSRIQSIMEKAMKEPEYLKNTIYFLLSDQWTLVALIIAEIRTMMAIIYERTGDYDKAIKACHEAREVYHRQLRRDSANHSENLTSAQVNYEMMTHMAEKLDEAKRTFDTRKELHEDVLQIHAEIKTAHGMGLHCDKLFDAIFDKLSLALGLEIQSLGKNHPQVAETLAFLSRLHLERNDKSKALVSMERATSVAEIALGSKHPITGKMYYELARQYENVNLDKADKINAGLYYEKALETYKEAEGEHSRIIGSISNDLGVLLLQQGQVDHAIHCLSDALAIYDSAYITDDICADTAQVWRNLAECYVFRKEWDMASANYESALNVQRDARKIFNTSSETNPNLEMPPLIRDENIADTLKRLGKAYAADQQYNQAYRTLLEGLTLLQNVCENVKKSSDTMSPVDLAYKEDQVANMIYCLAEVKEADKKYNEAIRLYDESLGFRLYSDRLREKGMKKNRVHIAMCLAGIGKMRIHRGEYSMAFKAFNEAIQNARDEDLPEYHPIVQMLWERSRLAAEEMEGEENSLIKMHDKGTKDTVSSIASEVNTYDEAIEVNEDTENTPENIQSSTKSCTQFSAWFQTTSRLDKKASLRKKKGDIEGALVAKNLVLEFQQAYLTKRKESKKSTTKAMRQVAGTLVEIANLYLIKEEVSEAEMLFKEATGLYKSSGLSKDADCMQQIRRELDRLRWQNKQRS